MHFIIGTLGVIGFIYIMCISKIFRNISFVVIGLLITISILNLQETHERRSKIQQENNESKVKIKNECKKDAQDYPYTYKFLCN